MDNKKTKFFSVIAIAVFTVVLVGATYAYFQAGGSTSKSTDVKVTTYTTDTFTFAAGDVLNFSIDQDTFANGKGNATGSTYAKAILTANNKTNTATNYYYLYLNIDNNTFDYTQNENTPEILLTIKNKNNSELTSVSGLTYKTVTDGTGNTVKGFDITNKDGLITIFDNRKITTTSTVEESWTVTVTFINYNLNQSANAGQSFSAKLIIQKDKITSLKDYIIAQYTGSQGNNGLYYHDSSLTNGAGDNSYRYAGGDYIVTTNAAMAGLNFVLSNGNDSVINMYCGGTKTNVGVDCPLTKYYILQYDTTNTHYTTYLSALEKAVADEYLAKDYVKNFVCFGSDASTCPTDNLYRIIGVIDGKVKLIKYDYASSALLGTNGVFFSDDPITSFTGYRGTATKASNFFWNKPTINIWSESNLNKINLNTNFINNIGSTWASKIANTKWKVGGNTWSNLGSVVPLTSYQNEIINVTDVYNAKVGLMYISDYAFATRSNYWTSKMNEYNNLRLISNNWMYMGLWEWVLTRNTENSEEAFNIMPTGEIGNFSVTNGFYVRVVFNLSPSVTYVSGDGSMNNPIRIN